MKNSRINQLVLTAKTISPEAAVVATLAEVVLGSLRKKENPIIPWLERRVIYLLEQLTSLRDEDKVLRHEIEIRLHEVLYILQEWDG